MAPFTNRKQAGELLGRRLKAFRKNRPLVLAIPRGGIPVAVEVAKALGAPLDLLAVSKVGVPTQENLSLGAVSEEGAAVLHEEVLEALQARFGFKKGDIEDLSEKKRAETLSQVSLWRKGRAPIQVRDRDVILVDDGIATGLSMEAAIKVMRDRGARKVIVAAPVAAVDALKRLSRIADEIVCLVEPLDFHAVGLWYRDFPDVGDKEIDLILKEGMEAPSERNASTLRSIPVSGASLAAELHLPHGARGIVLFVSAKIGSRTSPRSRHLAKAFHAAGVGTLLLDLVTSEEEAIRKDIVDVELLTIRLLEATNWMKQQYPELGVFFFGENTGATVALNAAARQPIGLVGVLSRGGHADLIEGELSKVRVPVLLVVGSLDHPVLASTIRLLDRFRLSRLEVVTGATHQFEEPGAIEQVADLACGWVKEHLPLGALRLFPKITAENGQTEEIRRLARPMDFDQDLERFAERLASQRVVMLGESTHGTHEFYAFRSRLSQILMEKHDFQFVAVEGDWPDCRRLEEYIQHGTGGNARDVAASLSRWPTWMWANEEVAGLAEWMRSHGKKSFYGLDLYSLFESIDAVRSVARSLDEEAERRILERYACFDPYARNEIAYARSLFSLPEGCRSEAISNLLELLDQRFMKDLEKDEWFSAQQNARVVKNAESYYRAMLEGDVSSWNLRDQHMMETLDLLLQKEGKNSKGIVWAHNTHIGDYRHSSMFDEGYLSLGGLARQRYGEDLVALVGLTTYEGQVTASSAWAGPEEIMKLPRARSGSIEALLHDAALNLGRNSILLEFDDSSRTGALSTKIGNRAIGVVYSAEAEASRRNYVPSVLPQRYDVVVFFDKSSALPSLHSAAQSQQVPETWPVGF